MKLHFLQLAGLSPPPSNPVSSVTFAPENLQQTWKKWRHLGLAESLAEGFAEGLAEGLKEG